MTPAWPGPALRIPRGDHVTLNVRVYDGRANLQAVGTPTGGTFRLRYRGRDTIALAYNATAAAVQAALEDLPGIRGGRVKCTGGDLPLAVMVEFTGDLSGEDPTDLEVVEDLVTGAGAVGYEVVPNPQDLTGWTRLDFTARISLYEGAAVFTRSLGSGVTIGLGTAGEATLDLAPAETRAAGIDAGRETVLWCDLQGKDAAGNYRTLWLGRLIVVPDVTLTEP